MVATVTLALTCVAILTPLALGGTIYVDQSATTGGDTGVDWNNAFLDLQDALEAAASGDEIWVAQGVYTPSVNPDPGRLYNNLNGEGECVDCGDFIEPLCETCVTAPTCPCDPQSAVLVTFRLVNGVAMYGGFASGGSSSGGSSFSLRDSVVQCPIDVLLRIPPIDKQSGPILLIRR
jgi:hypothetical protein